MKARALPPAGFIPCLQARVHHTQELPGAHQALPLPAGAMPPYWQQRAATRRKRGRSAACRPVSFLNDLLPALCAAPFLQTTKQQSVQASIERLETGLAKLRKTQGDVDVLIEQARVMAVEVEEKVLAANKFAEEVSLVGHAPGGQRTRRAQQEWHAVRCAQGCAGRTALPLLMLPLMLAPWPLPQVGVEKEKVHVENAAAQVEADACAAIAKEVAELQARCEGELAAAEPLVAEAEAALNTLTKKDLGGFQGAWLGEWLACCCCVLYARCRMHVVPGVKKWRQYVASKFNLIISPGCPPPCLPQASSRRCAIRLLGWTTSRRSCFACWRTCPRTSPGLQPVSLPPWLASRCLGWQAPEATARICTAVFKGQLLRLLPTHSQDDGQRGCLPRPPQGLQSAHRCGAGAPEERGRLPLLPGARALQQGTLQCLKHAGSLAIDDCNSCFSILTQPTCKFMVPACHHGCRRR